MDRVSSADTRIKHSDNERRQHINLVPHVYILYSKKFNRFYAGTTRNVAKRLLQHNNKESPFTAGGVSWTLVWSISKAARLDAEALERKLKNLSKDRKIRFMKKYHEGIQDLALLDSIP